MWYPPEELGEHLFHRKSWLWTNHLTQKSLCEVLHKNNFGRIWSRVGRINEIDLIRHTMLIVPFQRIINAIILASDLLDEFKIATVIPNWKPGLKTLINIPLTILLTEQRRFNLCLVYDKNHRSKSSMRYAYKLMMINVVFNKLKFYLSGKVFYWCHGPAERSEQIQKILVWFSR